MAVLEWAKTISSNSLGRDKDVLAVVDPLHVGTPGRSDDQ